MNEQTLEDIISALYDMVQDARALPLGADKCIVAYLVILGKKTNGAVVILRDKFNSSNRFKTITPGTEVANSVYSRGNLRSDTHSWTNDPYTLEDDIRQVRFICETPNHESCASGARISYQMSYMYSSSLI